MKLFILMTIRSLFLGIICFGLSSTLIGQDIHFTNFRLAPLTVNPALAGAFEGTIRLGGIYRGQWTDVNGYQTPALYADAPIIKGFRKNDWVGVGLSFFSDKAGIGGLTDTGGSINAAYHFGLDKKNINNNISIGISYGSVSRKLTNPMEFILRDEILEGVGFSSPDKQELLNKTEGDSYTDWAAGVTLHYDLNKKTKIVTGLMGGHLTTPINSLINTRSTNGFKLVGFAQLDMAVNKKVSFEPAMFFQSKSSAFELSVQGLAGYMLNPKKNLKVNAGLGYRVGDAFQFLFGAEYGDFVGGISFDATASSFQGAPSFQNGFEIGIGYIAKIYKKPKVKPVIICPRF